MTVASTDKLMPKKWAVPQFATNMIFTRKPRAMKPRFPHSLSSAVLGEKEVRKLMPKHLDAMLDKQILRQRFCESICRLAGRRSLLEKS